jgi:hypothetical protein
LVDNEATAALVREKGSAELLLPIVRQAVKVAEQDGKFGVYVVDGTGDRRYSGVTGEPMSIAELVVEMKADKRFARAFDAEAPAGGGMAPGSGKTSPKINNTDRPKSSVDKIRSGLDKGGLGKDPRRAL